MILQILHLLASCLIFCAVYITLTPPQPPPKKDERAEVEGQDTFEVSVMPAFVKVCCLSSSVLEMFLVLASSHPEWKFSRWVSSVSILSIIPHLSPLRIFVCSTALFGAVLRLKCYAYLGRHFTFELAILADHRLVTSGPYAYVRHPSYTAASLALFSALAWHTLPGAVFYKLCVHVVGESVNRQFCMSLWLVSVGVASRLLGKRLEKEDLMMKNEFGKEWELWATSVPKWLIPGIL